MESLRAKLATFTFAAQIVSEEHDDIGRSHRNRTTGEAAASGNIEDNEDDDATATSMNAPEALSNMELCSVNCK